MKLQPQSKATLLLIGYFLAWKILLLILANLAPGIGYDTSTSLQYDGLQNDIEVPREPQHSLHRRLIRWDALYFTSIARRGYLYEQEWAFSWGLTHAIRSICRGLFSRSSQANSVAWTAIAMSHSCHLLSVLLLYSIYQFTANPSSARVRTGLIVASLHIIAPAGLFLSAPNAEATFTFLSFAGYWLYVQAMKARGLRNDLSVLAAGLMFGAATTVRSNGILHGALFAIDLLMMMPLGFLQNIRYAICLVLAGLLNALGSAWPQYIAYRNYCTGTDGGVARPWCSSALPSVYTFVQERYWNVGFLRYWTLSNAPLFLLAVPMLALMTTSALLPLRAFIEYSSAGLDHHAGKARPEISFQTKIWARLAVPQLLLTVLALTNFHVQVITRLASGYVLPYILLADMISRQPSTQKLREYVKPKWIVRWMSMYALIQGGLYSSFLPPA